ncbi:TcpE family conjugal transfer membrane protein [Nocardiopsis sp. NPDC050513]|uniref:TcpE family conjugal transfer membrane protein n=1 Tax=Nocardiopsis sp. NPDC050513 TaxID=3364338 RepID=UPI00378B940A
MDLPTYTNIWRIEKRLYKLYDFRLPMPLPVGTFGVALGVFAIWVVLLSIVNAPFTFGNGWHLVLWVVPPGVITVLATRPVIEGKRLTELLISQARFLAESRVYTRLAPEYEPGEVRVVVRVWHRHPDAGPLPAVGRRRAEHAAPEVEAAVVEEATERPTPESAPPLVGVAGPAARPEPAVADEPVYVPAQDEDRAEAADTRGVSRRVLNYFGFALRPAPPAAAGGEADPREEHEEEGDDAAWLTRLRAPSGQTPVGLNAAAAYEVGDTAAMTRAEVDEATAGPERERERRRAEEVMSAPEPETAESSAARRLRGRVQGIRVARELDERRSERVRERAPQDPPSARSRATALPAGEPPRPPRRKGRPHAAPWELDSARHDGTEPEPSDRANPGGLSDYAERYAAATGRSVAPTPESSSAPWLPPASATLEDDSATGSDASAEPADPAKPPLELDHGTGEQAAMPSQPTADDEDRGPEWKAHMSVLDQHLSTADTPAPPRPKFADALRGGERAPEESSPAEWFDDGKRRHPDQPKVGDRGNPVIPASELREDVADPADPAEPAPGTASAPASAPAPAAEDAETGAVADGTPASGGEAADAKPFTQLDHGTGELASFAEVRGATDGDAGPGRRPAPRPGAVPGAAADTRNRSASDPRSPADSPAAEAEPGPRATPGPSDASASGTPSETSTDAESTASPRGSSVAGATAHSQDTPESTDAQTAPDAPAAASSEAETAVSDADSRSTPDPRRTADAPSSSDSRGGRALGPATPSEAVDEPSAGPGPAARTDADGAAAPRRTAADLEEAEAAALVRRREAARRPSDAPLRDPRANRSMADALSEERAAAPARDEASDQAAPHTRPDVHDPHDGAFHRVAQNARKLGHLFGRPAPGEAPEPPHREEPRPDLELDHGTGEQERLGDTPRGVPAPRPEPPSSEPEDPTAHDSGGTRGWRRLAKVVTGGATPVRSDLPASDIARLRTPMTEPRSLVVLGCTGGAGQTVTSLMIGHTLAAHRDEPVVAVDVNPGPNGLSRRVGAQTPETLTALLANADEVDDYARMRGYTSRASTGLEVVQTLDDPYVQTLDDRDYAHLTDLLGRFYSVTLLDPAATGVARALPVADGLVLVAPANADAERAVSMTFEWLDGNGYGALRAASVLVVNGVSKRSLEDVDAAERVARGRCRAIVRIPWDDHLGSSYTRIDVGALRPATKRAHGALGGVLVNTLTRT